MVRVILHGACGHMGHVVTDIVEEENDIEIVAGVDARNDGTHKYPVYQSIGEVKEEADVIIDFSVALAATSLIEGAVEKKLPLVLCTTGLTNDQLALIDEAKEVIPVLRSANMSLGINVLQKLVADAAKILGEAGYDIEIEEMHHKRKLDAPSGTARELIESMGEAVGTDLVSDAVYGRPLGRHPREKGKVTFHAVRGGDTPSSHTVFFFGEGERLEITHHCLNWKGCAKGAVNACRWMADKPVGLYGIRESMGL